MTARSAVALSLVLLACPALAAAREPADAPRSLQPTSSSHATGSALSLEAPSPISALRAGGIAVTSLGGAGLLTSLGLALASRAGAVQRDQLCAPGAPCASGRAFELDRQAAHLKQASIVSAAVGALATGSGIWMIVAGDRRSALLAGQTSLKLSPSLDGKSFQVSMSGAW